MKLSIIIPVFNTPNKYLIQCLVSISRQDESDFEVIIVDDGSKAETAELLDKYAQKDDRFKVFHKINEGVSKARNYGIGQATGEFITFVDSDDYVSCNMVSTALEIQKKYDADIVMWQGDQSINGKRNSMIYKGNGIDIFDNSNKEILAELVLYDNAYYEQYRCESLVCTWCKLYRRELIQTVKFSENIVINEDGLYIFNVIQKCDRFVITDEVLYHYVQWSGSASHAMKMGIDQNWIQNRQEYMKLIKASNYSKNVYQAYNKNVINPVKYMLFNIWANSENNGKFRRADFSRFIRQHEIGDSIKQLKIGDFKTIQNNIVLILLKLHLYNMLYLLTKIRVFVLRKKGVFV